MNAAIAALLTLAVLLYGGTGQAVAQRGIPPFERSILAIQTAAGKTHRFRIEIARTPAQQELGLMYRRKLAADAGMLFLHDRAIRARMWMKNTYVPLDMLFIDGSGRILEIKQRTIPHSLAIIASRAPVLAVLEVNAGTVSRLGLKVGDRLVHPAFQPAQ